MSAAYVWHMEDVLDLYAEPPDPLRPLVTFDERPVQLLSDVRKPLPCRPGQPRREDYGYKREGTCNLFCFFAPHERWRHVDVTERRTAVDLASLYQADPPEEARRLTKRLEFHYAPKHASWLNMTELELAVLSRRCLKRRLGSQEEVAREVAAWEEERNAAGATVTWRFTTVHARTRLARLYPL